MYGTAVKISSADCFFMHRHYITESPDSADMKNVGQRVFPDAGE